MIAPRRLSTSSLSVRRSVATGPVHASIPSGSHGTVAIAVEAQAAPFARTPVPALSPTFHPGWHAMVASAWDRAGSCDGASVASTDGRAGKEEGSAVSP